MLAAARATDRLVTCFSCGCEAPTSGRVSSDDPLARGSSSRPAMVRGCYTLPGGGRGDAWEEFAKACMCMLHVHAR